MSKYIYEYEETIHTNDPIKNQYTILYENKSYYYCKVNGSDYLKVFTKSEEDVLDRRGCFWSTSEFNLTETLNAYKEKQRLKKIESIKRNITSAENQKNLLLSRLDELNKEYEKLTTL